MTHYLKTWPEPFQAIADGRKTFEWRQNDRDFAEGDIVQLHEYKPADDEYTGRVLTFTIGYVLAEGFGIPSGFVCFSLIKLS